MLMIMHRNHQNSLAFIPVFRAILLAAVLVIAIWPANRALAAQNDPDQQASGSIGLEGTISTAAPTQAATITTPASGSVFNSLPVTVAGLCPTGLLVKIFSNNVFVGSAQCVAGSYSVQIDLFGGQDDLIARDYDALDQAGPDSNTTTVTFNDAQVAQFGTRVSLTSSYAKRGANPGQELDWPIIMSGGLGPYALSINWGDGSPTQLMSESFDGTITISHTYSAAGIFNIVVEASDSNGTQAYLQLVGVANGAIQSSATGQSSSTPTVQTKILWWPALAMLPLMAITFWIGRRHELFTIRKQLEENRSQY